jgi:hypothetical protein
MQEEIKPHPQNLPYTPNLAVEIWSPLCALSRNAPLLLSTCIRPLQRLTILICHSALPNLQTNKAWLEYKVFSLVTCAKYKSLKSEGNKLLWNNGIFKYTAVMQK